MSPWGALVDPQASLPKDAARGKVHRPLDERTSVPAEPEQKRKAREVPTGDAPQLPRRMRNRKESAVVRRGLAPIENPWALPVVEAHIFRLLCTGLEQFEIAEVLGLSSKTVSTYMTRSKERMAARSAQHAMLIWDREMREPSYHIPVLKWRGGDVVGVRS